MPYTKEHAARIRNPQLFANIVTLQTLSNGIRIIGGALKSNPKGSGKTQAYRFPKKRFTIEQAKKWLKDHNIKYISFEPAAKAIQSFVNLQGFQANDFTEQQILEMIPKETLNKIKEKDAHPFFQVYSICHPGVSTPKVLNAENKPITWVTKAVQSIKNLVLKGVKLFSGHNKDNSTDNREVIGEVVHDFQQEINGDLHHLVITYHNPKVRNEAKQYDICSQEAVWNLIETAKGYLAGKIEKLTGIALGKSDNEAPAFAGAQRRGMVQAMIQSFDEQRQPERSQSMGIGIEDFGKITITQLKQICEERNVWPWQIFTEDQIKNDKIFGKIYHENTKLKEEIDQVAKTITEKDKQISEFNQKENQLKLTNYRETAKKRIDRMMQLGNVTETQKKFVELKFNPENLTIEQLTDEALQNTLNQILSERQRLAAAGIITDKTETPPTPGNDKKENGGGPGDPGDYTKKANNELLTEDL